MFSGYEHRIHSESISTRTLCPTPACACAFYLIVHSRDNHHIFPQVDYEAAVFSEYGSAWTGQNLRNGVSANYTNALVCSCVCLCNYCVHAPEWIRIYVTCECAWHMIRNKHMDARPLRETMILRACGRISHIMLYCTQNKIFPQATKQQTL